VNYEKMDPYRGRGRHRHYHRPEVTYEKVRGTDNLRTILNNLLSL